MFINWLKESIYASGILLILRIYLGYTWFTAGLSKIIEGFDASGFMMGAVQNPSVEGWWVVFLETFAIPNVWIFNILVPWGELLVGLGFLLGGLTVFSALMGIVMNLSFLLSGAVGINPQMLFLSFIVLMAGNNAGRFGLDYYLLPLIKDKFADKIPVLNNARQSK